MNREIVLPADEKYVAAVGCRAGNITGIYEDGRLRYLSSADGEIIRMVYPALRDQNWGTILPVISDEKVVTGDHFFSISYVASYESADIRYRASYAITGNAEGVIRFSMNGEALSDFQKRRIGLCLLHPIEPCTGREIEVLGAEGGSYSSSFPEFVSPFQPFLNVRRMKYVTGNNTLVTIDFEGDIFETEDQRNWSDNSYKTYSTPLSVPAPALVKKGDVVHQSITITASAAGRSLQAGKSDERKVPFPRIGYLLGPGHTSLTDADILAAREIPLDHCTVRLALRDNWTSEWEKAAKEARRLEVPIELLVDFTTLDDEEVSAFADAIRPSGALITSILVSLDGQETAPRDRFERAYELLKKGLKNSIVGYGTAHDFADLNRNRPADIDFDFVNFFLQPQVHTTDSRSIIDNAGSHGTLVDSAKKFSSGRPVHVCPIGFGPEGKPDTRFGTAFCAWWTLLSLRNISSADSVTYYELKGPMGVMDAPHKGLLTVLKEIKKFRPKFIFQGTGSKVVLENASGDRLVFSSSMPAVNAPA